MMGLLSAVEPLRAANRQSGREVFRWEYFSETGEPVQASNGMSVVADCRFDQCQRYPFMVVCASLDPLEGASTAILNGLRRLARNGSDLGSIDTGAFLLAKAGLLQRRKVALHWESEASFHEFFPEVEIFSGLYWVDGNLCSSSGGTASIDMMGQLIRDRLGDGVALAVLEQFMHGPIRSSENPQRLSKSNRLQTFNGKLLRAVTLMEQHIEDPLSLYELSRQAGISERQTQRLFKQELGAGDIANMGFAEAADLPVVLIGDIDRGGVIASVIGTHAVIEPLERQRIQGFIINKFRGDVTLFDPGLAVIEMATGWPSLGVVTHCQAARRLPAEDALGLEQPQDGGAGAVRIALLKFARIANHDDFDPLRLEAEVELILVTAGQAIPGDCDLVILPGSKSTIGDLADLRAQGWDVDLRAHLRRGGQVLGICGGYQMLGAMIHDPDGIEGPAGSVAGLGLLAVETTMTAEKTLTQVTGRLHPGGQEVQGYEMHIGRTEGPDRARAFVRFADHSDGAVSADGKVAGCYLHGLFAADGARKALLAALGARADSGLAFDQAVESALDQVADHLEREINVEEILALARRR